MDESKSRTSVSLANTLQKKLEPGSPLWSKESLHPNALGMQADQFGNERRSFIGISLREGARRSTTVDKSVEDTSTCHGGMSPLLISFVRVISRDSQLQQRDGKLTKAYDDGNPADDVDSPECIPLKGVSPVSPQVPQLVRMMPLIKFLDLQKPGS